MDIEIVKRACVENPAAAAAIYDKAELYSALDGIAQQIRKQGESIFKARVRAGTTPEGAALMVAYNAAPKAQPVRKTAPVSVEEIRKALPGGESVARIDAIAQKIAADEKISLSQARARAWERHPEILQNYNKDRAYNLRLISGGRC